MRAFLCALLLIGCGPGDPCDAFPDESCFSLEVRGPGLSIDQVGLRAQSGFVLTDGRSPVNPGSSFGLPVRLAVVPGGKFAGAVELEVRGLLEAIVIGSDLVHATVAAGQHLSIIAELGGSHASDLAGIDLSGKPDLARPPGADLASPPGSDLAVAGYVVENLVVTDSQIMGLWGSASNDVYVITLSGDIFHTSGGGAWIKQRDRLANEVYDTLWGSAGNDIWAGGGLFPCGGTTGGPANCRGLLLHSTGGGVWSSVTVPGTDPNFGVQVYAVGGVNKNDIYISLSGDTNLSGILHATDGVTFTVQKAFGSQAVPQSLFAASASAIYGARGLGEVVKGPGTWPADVSGLSDLIEAVGGTSTSDLWAAGFDFNSGKATIYHSTGTGTWTPQATNNTFGQPTSVSAVSPSNIYVGCLDAVLHSTGDGTWTPETLPSHGDVGFVAAFADGAVYAAGAKGVVLHKR